MRSFTLALLLGSALAGACGGGALAQVTPQPGPNAPPASPPQPPQSERQPAAAPTAVNPQDVGVLSEVVVTAQRRSENLQAVPITVTALSAQALSNAGVTNTKELTLVTPGLSFSNITSQASPTIRGVATRGVGPGDEPSVPIYIDGVYQSSTASGFFEFNNVDRIEVLKGPQGTLFGRNAEGGVINIITLQPSFSPFASGDVSYGSYDQVKANLYVTSPITDKLAVNLAIHTDDNSGYVQNLSGTDERGQADSTGVRGKLLYKPSEKVDLTVGVNYTHSNDNTAYSGYPLDGNTIAKRVQPTVVIAGPDQTAVTGVFSHVQQYGGFANLHVAFDSFDMTLLGSYLNTQSALHTDSDITAYNYQYASFPTFDESMTAELKFASKPGGKLDWIGGINGYTDYGKYGRPDYLFLSQSSPTGATLALISKINTASVGAFGEVTYHLTPKLSVTGGLRLTYEHREKSYASATTAFALLPNISQPVFLGRGEHHYENASGRASIKYDVTDNTHAFFTFSQGFKSGFSNASSGPPFVWLQPETLDNYEVGVKSDLTRNLRVNLTGFYLTYDNLQVSARDPTGKGTTAVFNAASAENYGFELSTEWHPTSELQFTLGVANQHARYTSFPAALTYFPATSTDAALTNLCVQGSGVLIGGNRSTTCNATDHPLARSPDWTVSLTSQYSTDLWGGRLQLGGVLAWTDDFIWDLYGTLGNGGGYYTLNAHATYTLPDARTSFTVYSDNITDSRQSTNRYQGASGTYAIQQLPATVGVRVAYKTR